MAGELNPTLTDTPIMKCSEVCLETKVPDAAIYTKLGFGEENSPMEHGGVGYKPTVIERQIRSLLVKRHFAKAQLHGTSRWR